MHLHSQKSQVEKVQEDVGETQSQMQQDANGLEIDGKSMYRTNTPLGYPHSGHVHLQEAPLQRVQLLYAPIKVAICRKVGESLFGMQVLKC